MASEPKPDNQSRNPKRQGFSFWKETLGSPSLVVAPMVDQSELAWRMMSRRHKAQLCYTPMLHASVFVRDAGYRAENLLTCTEDRPLIVQFCANDKDTLVKAGLLAQHMCDAIDINLGCPQLIAKRGHYGAYLQDEWDLLESLISACHTALSVPITAKIRVFPSIEKTVAYATMLERAGAQLLTVHGRTREQKGPLTGLASWAHIKAVREAVTIPVFANGNIQYLEDVHKCLSETGVQGVMIAEGSLHNPALFDGVNPAVWDMVREYLELAQKYPCNLTYVRGHLFKMCIHAFDVYNEWRILLGDSKSLESVISVMDSFIKVLKEDEQRYMIDPGGFDFGKLRFPYWICQPYVRPDPVTTDPLERNEAKRLRLQKEGRLNKAVPENLQHLSKKKLRKALQKPHKSMENIEKPGREKFSFCVECKTNARGVKCELERCKLCCRIVCKKNAINCPGHHVYFKPKTQKLEEPTT